MISKEIVTLTVQNQIQHVARLKARQFGVIETMIHLRIFNENGELKLHVLLVKEDNTEVLEVMTKSQVMGLFNIPLFLKMLKIEESVTRTLENLLSQKDALWLVFSVNSQSAFVSGELTPLVLTDFENAFYGTTTNTAV